MSNISRTYYLFHPSDLSAPFNEIVADSTSEVRSLLRTYYVDADDIRIRKSPDPIS
jgi:hypothetical protein